MSLRQVSVGAGKDQSTVAAANPAPADILLANILAEPLEALAASLSSLVIGGGRLVLSGLLAEQAGRVASRYAPWFDIAPMSVRDGWARLDGVRRADPLQTSGNTAC